MNGVASFYDENPSRQLRLGDVVAGFENATPQLDDPLSVQPTRLVITVSRPTLCVILTPCCSIEDESILLAPLQQIRPQFLRNPHLEQDLTRINREVAAEKAMPPEAWNRMPEDQRLLRMAKGPAFIFRECFIYAPHPLLPVYRVQHKSLDADTGCYMVDFKTIYRLGCRKITRSQPEELAGLKRLQLTVQTRGELRHKLSFFFYRRPEEDE